MKLILKKYIPILLNKYFLAIVMFLFIMFFSERNGLINQCEQKSKYNKALEENEYYGTEIKKLQNDHDNLFSNPKNLEKFAREKFLMKRDDEDVFIVIKK